MQSQAKGTTISQSGFSISTLMEMAIGTITRLHASLTLMIQTVFRQILMGMAFATYSTTMMMEMGMTMPTTVSLSIVQSGMTPMATE